MNAGAFVDSTKLFEMKTGAGEIIQANQIFIEQVKNYEYNAEHDDAPDSLAGVEIFMGLLNDK